MYVIGIALATMNIVGIVVETKYTSWKCTFNQETKFSLNSDELTKKLSSKFHFHKVYLVPTTIQLLLSFQEQFR